MPKDIPHSLPYPGVSSLAAAGQSYMNHPQHYQKLGTDENYDQEANEVHKILDLFPEESYDKLTKKKYKITLFLLLASFAEFGY